MAVPRNSRQRSDTDDANDGLCIAGVATNLGDARILDTYDIDCWIHGE